MDAHISSEPPHADIRRALVDDVERLGNGASELTPSIAELVHSDHFLSWTARQLVRFVGSVEQLENLTAKAHRVEPGDFDGLSDVDRTHVVALLDIIEDSFGRALDDEYRAIIRRICCELAVHADRPLRGKSDPKRMAAAVVWVAFRASGELDRSTRWTATDLWFAFQVTSCAKLGQAFARALDHENRDFIPDDHDLAYMSTTSDGAIVGSPGLLHSRFRTHLVTRRDDLNQQLAQDQLKQSTQHPMQIRGDSIQFHGRPTTVRWAMRGEDDNGRAQVIVGLGDLHAMEVVSVSITDARRLVEALEHALNQPAPGLTPV